MKTIKLELDFYDCSDKKVLATSDTPLAIKYDVSLQPKDQTIDLTQAGVLKAADPLCPITSWVLKTE